MAWEDFNHNGRSGITGDKPIDEISLALKRIARAYEDRYDRKPTLVEVLYALEVVLSATPADFLADPDSVRGDFTILPIQRASQ